MNLRPARPSDLPDIARLHEANWRRDYAGILPDIALGKRLSEEMAARWGQGALATSRVFVAYGPDALLGFAAMREIGPDGGPFLENLHVAPTARAQGVGRALMSAVAVLSVPNPLTLEVPCANTTARAIYRGWGGRESVEFDDTILGHSVPAVCVGWQDCSHLVERLRGAHP